MKRKDIISCISCFEQFAPGQRDPICLSDCGHTICRVCSDSLKTRECPTCRVSITQQGSINYLVLEMVESIFEMEIQLKRRKGKGPIRVYMKNIMGKIITFQGTKESTCLELRQFYAESYNISIESLRLIYNPHVWNMDLPNELTFQEAGIIDVGVHVIYIM